MGLYPVSDGGGLDKKQPLALLPSVENLAEIKGRWSFTLGGRRGLGQPSESGLLLALQVDAEEENSMEWLRRATLLLVAQDGGLDDALVGDSGSWWLWHLYPDASTPELLDQGLLLQGAMAQVLEQLSQKPKVGRSNSPIIAAEQRG